VRGDVDISEEDDHIVIDVAFRIDTAEEADGVMNRLAGWHNDVGAELDAISVSSGGCGGEGCEQ
jgi:hypothetical protein